MPSLLALQENGNRLDTRWLRLADSSGRALRITGDRPFHLSTRRWADQELAAGRS
ncbi:hypothetical protein [Nonomuraea sp. 10N515B]|uniref:hypothetical protein n=1 Tax=Nonomuraea sp. 10N515B TaxID=3457422 RepID=UPI003FCC8CE4